jgi:hypothetical protein
MSNAATATAVARVQEEHYQPEAELQPSTAIHLPEPALAAAANLPERTGYGNRCARAIWLSFRRTRSPEKTKT